MIENGPTLIKDWKIFDFIDPLLSKEITTREEEFSHGMIKVLNPLPTYPILDRETEAHYVKTYVNDYPFICISTPETKALTSVLITENKSKKELILSREHVGYNRMLDLEVAMHQLFSGLIRLPETTHFFEDPTNIATIDILREAASYCTQKSLSGLLKNGHSEYIIRDMIAASHRKRPDTPLGRTVELIRPKLEGIEGRTNWIIADSPASGITIGAVLEYLMFEKEIPIEKVLFVGQYASYKAVMALSELCKSYGLKDVAFASLGAPLLSDEKMYFSAFPREEWRSADKRETAIIKALYGNTPFCIGGDFTANVENPDGALQEFKEEQDRYNYYPNVDDRLMKTIKNIIPLEEITPYSTKINAPA